MAGGESPLWGPFYKGMNPIHGGTTLRPGHLPKASTPNFGDINMWISGGHQHPICSSAALSSCMRAPVTTSRDRSRTPLTLPHHLPAVTLGDLSSSQSLHPLTLNGDGDTFLSGLCED